jgi:hypothetical protein
MAVLSSACGALQRFNYENSIQIFPEKDLRGHSPNFHIHVSVSDLYIHNTIDLPILLQEICGPILGIYKSIAHRHMNVEIKAAQFQEKEYINGILVRSNAAYSTNTCTRKVEQYSYLCAFVCWKKDN